ncbi:hypothetical protein B0H66DRAFT_70369 [Apodospora peruviana]|uniref:Uncharacterized protein n=1 Tax=Apodospora peruviana TaxID=516989 RepID=A0AAE0ISY5_9PEZI|nr:hypothetical protein B0H66DRAFT_70369 [Apodospora peruviana]
MRLVNHCLCVRVLCITCFSIITRISWIIQARLFGFGFLHALCICIGFLPSVVHRKKAIPLYTYTNCWFCFVLFLLSRGDGGRKWRGERIGV